MSYAEFNDFLLQFHKHWYVGGHVGSFDCWDIRWCIDYLDSYFMIEEARQ